MSESRPGEDEDDFGVRLDWPSEAQIQPFDVPARDAEAESDTRVQPRSEPDTGSEDERYAPPVEDRLPPRPPTPRFDPAPSMGPALTALPPEAEGVGPLLAAVAARVDALSAVTVTFRNLMSDHVAQQGQRIDVALRELALEAEEHRRRQQDAVGELRNELRGVAAEVRELTRAVQAMSTAGVEPELQETLTTLLDEVRSLRRRTPVRPKGQALDADQVQAMAQAVAEQLQAGTGRPAPARRPRKST